MWETRFGSAVWAIGSTVLGGDSDRALATVAQPSRAAAGPSSTTASTAPADVVLLSADRRARAPLRAQLMEDGFEVIATDTWALARRHLRPGSKPRLAVIDLGGLDNPARVVAEVRLVMKPASVLVIAAAGTVPPDDLARAGFVVVKRPVSIGEIVAAVATAIERLPR
jgi:DNA-binding response OmpR family regulator